MTRPMEEIREALDEYGLQSRLEGGYSLDSTQRRADAAMAKAQTARIKVSAALDELADLRRRLEEAELRASVMEHALVGQANCPNCRKCATGAAEILNELNKAALAKIGEKK